MAPFWGDDNRPNDDNENMIVLILALAFLIIVPVMIAGLGQ